MHNRGRKTLVQDGINWRWYLEIEHQGSGRGEVTILRHWRIHKGDDGAPETSGGFELLEDSKRTVCAVLIDGWAVVVANRMFIWDYPDTP